MFLYYPATTWLLLALGTSICLALPATAPPSDSDPETGLSSRGSGADTIAVIGYTVMWTALTAGEPSVSSDIGGATVVPYDMPENSTACCPVSQSDNCLTFYGTEPVSGDGWAICYISPPSGQTGDVWTKDDVKAANCAVNLHSTQGSKCIGVGVAESPCTNSGTQIQNAEIWDDMDNISVGVPGLGDSKGESNFWKITASESDIIQFAITFFQERTPFLMSAGMEICTTRGNATLGLAYAVTCIDFQGFNAPAC